MTMQSHCRQLADDVEAALGVFGADWSAQPMLAQKITAFRASCQQLGNNRGLSQMSIAFVGPKKAGKSTLLSLLVEDDALQANIVMGESSAAATEKLTWIGEDLPTDLLGECEIALSCRAGALRELGFSYLLLDVPSFNERVEIRSRAALQGLDNAAVKVLVVDRRSLEDRAITRYVGQSDGATIVPVINLVRHVQDPDREDFNRFHQVLQHTLPHATIHPPVLMPDLDLAEFEDKREQLVEQGRLDLMRSLQAAVAGRSVQQLIEPQLAEKYKRFKHEIGTLMHDQLPATREVINDIRQVEATLPHAVIEELLSVDDAVQNGIRQRLRHLFIERTPSLFFPWRTLASLAHRLQGALDRLPMALMGSLPSLLTTSLTAVKNHFQAQAYANDVETGVKSRAEALVRCHLHSQLDELRLALHSDLHLSASDRRFEQDETDVVFTGIDRLQRRSQDILDQVLDLHALPRLAAVLWGGLGSFVFWGICMWPIYALYAEYFTAVNTLVSSGTLAIEQFPQNAMSMLLTSFFLALLPMGLLLVAVLNQAGSRTRMRATLADVRERHQAVVRELTDVNLLRITVRNRPLQACLFLMGLREADRVLEVDVTALQPQPECIAVDGQANHHAAHVERFAAADRSASQVLN